MLFQVQDTVEEQVGKMCVIRTVAYYHANLLSQGRIWLENLDCTSGDEVIEDCSHRGWGVNYYCSHWNDVGVVCRPNGTLFH